MLSKNQFDIALIQGGLRSKPESPIRQICALQIEPLHLLVKPELEFSISEKGLSILVGRKVNVGATGSGTHSLATEVLRFAGLTPEGSGGQTHYHPNLFNYTELMHADIKEMPDAVFSVSTLPSPIADFLTDKHDYRLVPLLFGEALAIAKQPGHQEGELGPQLAEVVLDRRAGQA